MRRPPFREDEDRSLKFEEVFKYERGPEGAAGLPVFLAIRPYPLPAPAATSAR